jgi:cytochrome c oxidase assembly protein subunit 15
MNDKEWEDEFERYKQFPEYEKKNHGMTVKEFKYIFWYEYGHRMLGRAIGVVWVLPSLYLCTKSHLPKSRLLGISALIGGQGYMGWYMVKSGLDRDHRLMKEYNTVPRVSQYRLASHLSLALVIYSSMLWTYLDYARKRVEIRPNRMLKWMVPLTFVSIAITAFSGAFVAGMDAGLVYNEFPYMGTGLVPPGMLALNPKWKNFFENTVTVQFQHRCLAIFSFCLGTSLFLVARKNPLLKRNANIFMALLTLQVALGISTLLMYVPTPLAASHQVNSLGVLTACLFLMHKVVK